MQAAPSKATRLHLPTAFESLFIMQYYSSYPIDEFDVSEASVYNDCASPKAHIMQNKVTTFTRTNDTKQSRPICANVRSRNLHINELVS